MVGLVGLDCVVKAEAAAAAAHLVCLEIPRAPNFERPQLRRVVPFVGLHVQCNYQFWYITDNPYIPNKLLSDTGFEIIPNYDEPLCSATYYV